MDPRKPSEKNREIARFVRYVWGGDCRVTEFADATGSSTVDIAVCVSRPDVTATTYGTLGLSDHPMMQDGREFPARAELVGVCDSSIRAFPNLLASAAFCIIKSHWFCRPGAVLRGALDPYSISTTLRHLYFMSPFLWDELVEARKFAGVEVAWLLGVPISDAELEYLDDHGDEELERLFEREQINLYDIDRMSAV